MREAMLLENELMLHIELNCRESPITYNDDFRYTSQSIAQYMIAFRAEIEAIIKNRGADEKDA